MSASQASYELYKLYLHMFVLGHGRYIIVMPRKVISAEVQDSYLNAS
jgi:hypothetical protein